MTGRKQEGVAPHHALVLAREALVEAVQEFLDLSRTWIWNWFGVIVALRVRETRLARIPRGIRMSVLLRM